MGIPQFIRFRLKAATELPEGGYTLMFTATGLSPDGEPYPVISEGVPLVAPLYEFMVPATVDDGVWRFTLAYAGSTTLPVAPETISIQLSILSNDGLFPEAYIGTFLLGMRLPATDAGYAEFISYPPFVNVTPSAPPAPVPETPPTPAPPVETSLSSFWAPIANWFSAVIETATKALWDRLNVMSGRLENISNFFRDPIGAILDRTSEIFTRNIKESQANLGQIIADAGSHSPEWKQKSDVGIKSIIDDLGSQAFSVFNPDKFHHSLVEPSAAATNLTILGAASLGLNAAGYAVGIAAEGATLGQVESVTYMIDSILNGVGVPDFTKAAFGIPLDALVMKPARYHWLSVGRPEIPATNDLINMVVKEKITLEQFKVNMGYQGFADEWSQKIWDAHFIAPSLGQLLTSWRRNHISTEELDRLEVLVDLDPIYKHIWEDQRYSDPSITEARFMFETGAIDAAQVKEIVARNGLFPSDVDKITDFIIRFQERLFRRRAILTVAQGYRLGVFTADRVKQEVTGTGYTEGVAEWVIHNEDLKKEIAAAKTKPEKDILVTLSIAIDAYVHNDVDDTWLRSYFSDKGYDANEIDISMKVYARKKAEFVASQSSGSTTEESSGGLSVSMNVITGLYVNGDVTEEQLRQWFLAKGYSEADTNLYIVYWNNMKSKQ